MKKSFLLFLITALLLSCNASREYFPKSLKPEEVSISRFDSALLSLDGKQVVTIADLFDLYAEYPYFMPIFAEDIIGIPVSDTLALASALEAFLQDTLYGFSETNNRVKSEFGDISDIRHDLSVAFARLHYLYPDIYIPKITLFVSGFNASLLFVDSPESVLASATANPMATDIAIGCDMYLGSDYEYYNRVVYNYQKQTMRKECIAVDVVSAYMFRCFPFQSQKNRLLDNMIYRGKVMYVLSQLFPSTADYEIMGYSREQWDWCERHERAVWRLMMDHRDLFKTESMILTSYLNDGPFTAEVSQEAPARLGTWIGWQIVASYMEHNEAVTLQDLLANSDAQQILEDSYYKP